nr:hypothetical protein [Acidovorax sp. SUPP3334]
MLGLLVLHLHVTAGDEAHVALGGDGGSAQGDVALGLFGFSVGNDAQIAPGADLPARERFLALDERVVVAAAVLFFVNQGAVFDGLHPHVRPLDEHVLLRLDLRTKGHDITLRTQGGAAFPAVDDGAGVHGARLARAAFAGLHARFLARFHVAVVGDEGFVLGAALVAAGRLGRRAQADVAARVQARAGLAGHAAGIQHDVPARIQHHLAGVAGELAVGGRNVSVGLQVAAALRHDGAPAVGNVALDAGEQAARFDAALLVVQAPAGQPHQAARLDAGAEVVDASRRRDDQAVADIELAPVDELPAQVERQVVGADAARHDVQLAPVGQRDAQAPAQQRTDAALRRAHIHPRQGQRLGVDELRGHLARHPRPTRAGGDVARPGVAGAAAPSDGARERVGPLHSDEGRALDVALHGLALGRLRDGSGLHVTVARLLHQGQSGGRIDARLVHDGAAVDGDGIAHDGAGVRPGQGDGGCAAAGVQPCDGARIAFHLHRFAVRVLAFPDHFLVNEPLLDGAATDGGVRGFVDERAVEAATDIQLRPVRHIAVAHYLRVREARRGGGDFVSAVEHVGHAAGLHLARGLVVDGAAGAAGDGDAALVQQGAAPAHLRRADAPALAHAHLNAVHLQVELAQRDERVAGGVAARSGQLGIGQAAHHAAVGIAARADVQQAACDDDAAGGIAETARRLNVDLGRRAALAVQGAGVGEGRTGDGDVAAQHLAVGTAGHACGGFERDVARRCQRAVVVDAAGGRRHGQIAVAGDQLALVGYAGGIDGHLGAADLP